MYKALIISLIGHFVVLHFLHAKKNTINKQFITKFIEIKKIEKKQIDIIKKTVSGLKSSKKKLENKFSHMKLSDLTPKSISIKPTSESFISNNEITGNFGDNNLVNQNRFLGTILNKVFTKIKQNLYYPEILLSKKIPLIHIFMDQI